MKQIVLRQIARLDEHHRLHMDVPAEFSDQVEVIIRSLDDRRESLTEDESFNLAAYAAVTEADEQEDALWGKYVRD